MNYKKMLTGVLAGLLLCLQNVLVEAVAPNDAPKDIKYILGMYYGNGENILIRENLGRLELLYRFAKDDITFEKANIYPLTKEHFDAYIMHEVGPMSHSEAKVRFERDHNGYGIACRVGGHTYTRHFLGSTVGERADMFKLPILTSEQWAKLRDEAKKSIMPSTLALGEQAELVDVSFINGVKVKSVYSSAENCFVAPLYTDSKLYVAKQLIAAIENAQKQLAGQGYGLLILDGYRPWHISKLAYLALPEDKKGLLENPDKIGSVHNTGFAIDVTLYDLKTGEELELPSGFDEPSIRQYTSYAGGTAKQRYLRQVLRSAMENNGFDGIEMEWWHFNYKDVEKMAHLNIEFK